MTAKNFAGAPRKWGGTKGDYLLHAFVAENALFIGQEKVTDKENEIPAIPRLLDKLDIKGSIISIDAMGTQVDIAEKIINNGGHYFLAVKENQSGLLAEMQDEMKYNKPVSTYSSTEKEHARVETRSVSIFDAALMEDKEITIKINKRPRLKLDFQPRSPNSSNLLPNFALAVRICGFFLMITKEKIQIYG